MCRATAAAAARSSAVTSAVLGAVRPADHVAVSRIESKPACCASVIFASGAPHFAASSTAPIFSDGPATAAGATASAPSSTDTTTLTPNTPSEGGGRDSNPRPPGPQPGALPTELPPPRVPKGSAQCRRGWGVGGKAAHARPESRAGYALVRAGCRPS